MYCQKCGQELENETLYCPKCGYARENSTSEHTSYIRTKSGKNINVLFPAFVVFGFVSTILSLIVSLLMYFFLKEQHENAAAALKGTVVGFGVKIIFALVILIIFVSIPVSLFNGLY